MFLDQSTSKLSSRAKGPIIVVPLLSHTNLPLVAHCCSLSLYIKKPYCVYRCLLSLHKSTLGSWKWNNNVDYNSLAFCFIIELSIKIWNGEVRMWKVVIILHMRWWNFNRHSFERTFLLFIYLFIGANTD
jgi:hypothetical protein